MFRSKQEVDKHVDEVFRRIKNDAERNSKCCSLAKLYLKVGDYESAVKYINRYLFSFPNSALAYKILGEAYEGADKKNKALDAYKTSLEHDGKQSELVLKVCQLLLDPKVDYEPSGIAFWIDRAESSYPKHPVVFQLKEQLLKYTCNGTESNDKLEKLYVAAINARPTDVKARIHLLKFYLDTKRPNIAFQHALDLNSRGIFHDNVHWYDCLCQILQVYENESAPTSMGSIIQKVSWLERRANLSMEEFHCDFKKSITDCCSALFDLDQALHQASTLPDKRILQNEFYLEFLNHMGCQLSFHFATLALKRAKKEHGIWQKAVRTASPLLLQATRSSMDSDGNWFMSTPDSWKKSNDLKFWIKDAAFRISQAGHVLHVFAQEKGNQFLEKVSQSCGGKWRERVYQDVFYSREHQQAMNTSYFISEGKFADIPLKLPSLLQLNTHDRVSQSVYPESLHYLVWLGLVKYSSDRDNFYQFSCSVVEDLQFSVDNLNATGPESLNQLDIDAFLYASVLCATSVSPSFVSSEKPHILPAGISEHLCSANQSGWWSTVYKTYKNQLTGNFSDQRFKLRRGIETIRAFGNHGLDVKLLVLLAKLFEERAKKSTSNETLSALEARTTLYWTAAIPLLERLEKNQLICETPNKLFTYKGKDLTTNEIKKYIEDGKLYLACQLMKEGKNEEAVQAFLPLKNPYATFYQAMIYKKLACEELNRKPELITSENRSQHVILLTRARDCLFLTLDRLRSPATDPRHPLNNELHTHLEEIETQLCRIDPDSNFNRHEDAGSDESDCERGPLSPVGVGNNFNSFAGNNLHSTPRVLRHPAINQTTRNNNISFNSRTEARPSPERLDAQLRHLVQSYGGMQSLVEQIQTVVQELKDIKSLLSSVKELPEINVLLNEIRNSLQDIAEIKQATVKPSGEAAGKSSVDDLKEEDLYILPDDEDYTEDLNQLTQQYTGFQNYSNYNNYRQMPGIQGTSTLIYGAPGTTGNTPLIPPTQTAPFLPSPFHAVPRPVAPLDHMLLYQQLGYYQGLPLNEGQGVYPEFRGPGPHKGAPFAKNVHQASEPVIRPQPPNVVITSSDTLPAYTSSTGPIMSVTIPPQHLRGVNSQTIKPGDQSQVHAFQIPMPPQAHLVNEFPLESTSSTLPIATSSLLGSVPSPIYSAVAAPKISNTPNSANTSFQTPEKALNSTNENDTVESEHDPYPDFKPIVPLPDEVEVTSGEEEEVKLFESRAKLYRYLDKEWKERGLGQMKILHNEKTNRVRVLMRRDAIFKICANHFITSDLELCKMPNNDRAWIWIANDFADEEVKSEKFCVRFKTIDEAKDFEYAFNKGKEIAMTAVTSVKIEKPITSVPDLKSTPGCWECSTCLIRNDLDKTTCMACETPKISSSPASLNASTSSDTVTKVAGFTFIKPPVFQPPPVAATETTPDPNEKAAEAPKTNVFSSWSFPTTTTSQTLSFAPSTKVVQPPSFAPAQTTEKKEEKGISDSNFASKIMTGFGDFAKLATETKVAEAFKKNENFKGFEGAGSPVFAVASKTPPKPIPKERTPSESHEEGQGDTSEFVPTAEFTPVVPLPDLIEIKSGEEEETVLFEERCKLLRFDSDNREWKERGLGKMKLLLDGYTGRVRLLMRREQVLKVCCNHHLTKDMEFKPMSTSEKAVLWLANDYSEEELKTETFALKFGKSEQMRQFKKVIEETQQKMVNDKIPVANSGVKQAEVVVKPLSEMFKPKPGSWECSVCFIRNEESKAVCVACTTPKISASPNNKQQTSLTEMFKPKPGAWECPVCLISNNSTTVICAACTTPKPGTEVSKPEPKGIILDPKLATQFSFGIPAGTTATPVAYTATPTTPFSFGVPLSNTTPSSISTSSIIPGTGTLTFGIPKMTEGSPFTFNTPTSKVDQTLKTPGDKGEGFKFGSAGKFVFSFSGVKSPTKSPGMTGAISTEESEPEPEEDEGEHLCFQPVVPLPDKVLLVTGEEDEDILYCHRAKLFRFVDSDWKERGIGDLKILQHKISKKIRFLMRRDQVLKICLNHYLSSNLELIKKDDKSWLWFAADFSEGEVQDSKFAVRFKTGDIAQDFKIKVDEVLKLVPESPDKSTIVSDAPNKDSTQNFKFKVPMGETPKSSETKPVMRKLFSESSDSEVQVVYEVEVTKEQRDAAMRLQLPPNFYSYLSRPKCPGCPGCDTDSEEEVTSTSAETTTFLFGNKVSTQQAKNAPSTVHLQKESQKSLVGTEKTDVKNIVGVPGKTNTKSLFGVPTKTDATNIFVAPDKPDTESVFSISEKTGAEKGEVKNIFGGSENTNSKSIFGVFDKTNTKNIFGGAENTDTKNIFGGAENTDTKNIFGGAENTDTKNVFGGGSVFGSSFTLRSSIFSDSVKPNLFDLTPVARDNQMPKTNFIFGSSLGSSDSSHDTPTMLTNFSSELSFANLSKSPATFKTDPSKKFTFGGEIQPVFGKKLVDKTEEEPNYTEDTGVDSHVPQFATTFPFSDAVKIGEDDEIKVFGERAMLFRYNSKEWKEHGVGEMKVLHHPINNTFRFLLRREQEDKIVCNQTITEDLTLNHLTDSGWCWTGMNYIEEQGVVQQLAIQFDNIDLSQKFKDIVLECQEKIKASIKEKPLIPTSVDNSATEAKAEGDTNDEREEDYEEDDEEDEDDYEEQSDETSDNDENTKTVCTLYNFILYIYNDQTDCYEIKGEHVMMQVLMSREDCFRIIIEDTETGVVLSHTKVSLSQDTIFKVTPLDCMWVAEDYEYGKQCRNIFIRFASEDDTKEFLHFFGECEPPDEMQKFVRNAEELWTKPKSK